MPQPARAQATASAAVMASDPTAMVKGVVDQAAAVVRDTQTPTAERDKRLRAIAEANFDFADMARTTLGYHWRQITPQQQKAGKKRQRFNNAPGKQITTNSDAAKLHDMHTANDRAELVDPDALGQAGTIALKVLDSLSSQ